MAGEQFDLVKKDHVFEFEHAHSLLTHLADVTSSAHAKFLTVVNQQLGDITAQSDAELDVKDDLWLLDMNYRLATGALHDVFVETRETFANCLSEYKDAEAKRKKTIGNTATSFSQVHTNLTPDPNPSAMTLTHKP